MSDPLATYRAWTEAAIGYAPSTDKFIHVQAGLILWVAAALLLRCPLWAWRPLGVVGALAIANEVADRLSAGAWNWPDTVSDLGWTLLWPCIIVILVRQVPRLRRRV